MYMRISTLTRFNGIIFQIEGQEHLDVNIKNIDEDLDTNWYCDS